MYILTTLVIPAHTHSHFLKHTTEPAGVFISRYFHAVLRGVATSLIGKVSVFVESYLSFCCQTMNCVLAWMQTCAYTHTETHTYLFYGYSLGLCHYYSHYKTKDAPGNRLELTRGQITFIWLAIPVTLPLESQGGLCVCVCDITLHGQTDNISECTSFPQFGAERREQTTNS